MVTARGFRTATPRAARERIETLLDRPAYELLTDLQADREALARLLVDAGILAREQRGREK